MSETTLWGYKAHLVLEDENGAFEVLSPFSSSGLAAVQIDASRVLEAINQRDAGVAPLFREVKFDGS